MEYQSLNSIFSSVKAASRKMGRLTEERRNEILLKLSDTILSNADSLLEANARDLARMNPDNPLYDRLKLTRQRLEGIASDMRHVASLPSPLGESIA